PTCVPCIKEIPVVNHLYEYLEISKKARFYIVTDPYSIVDNSEKMSFEEVSEKARFILKDDSNKRKIFAPILIMKPPFRVAPGKGLVTGMPETLLFRTQPLRLFYNFIGPISEEQNPVLIPKDSKVQFIKRMIGG
ncbi:MAG: TlpA family protein disulfide reductase, partial [Leptospira sp.]|nr:TlpA family protein disulfide reductase [Leptospira sp.]